MSGDDIVERLRNRYPDVVHPHLLTDARLVGEAAWAIEERDDEIERLRAEAERRDAVIERLRAAIGRFLAEVDDDHKPEWADGWLGQKAGKEPWCCKWCGTADGSWPCAHRMALDELREARNVGQEATGSYRTKSGRILTDADINALADEAERGYDIAGPQGGLT